MLGLCDELGRRGSADAGVWAEVGLCGLGWAEWGAGEKSGPVLGC